MSVVKFLPPCFLSLFLPSSFIITSWSKRDNFLFSRAPFSWTESKGSEDTLFKQSSLAGISVEFITCADWARFRLPLTGSDVTSDFSSFYKNAVTRVTVFLSILSCSRQESNGNEISMSYFSVHLTAPTFNSKTLASR